MRNRSCPKCGASAPDESKFCPQCGTALPPPIPPAPANPQPSIASSAVETRGVGGAAPLVWQIEVKLLGNRFFLRDTCKWMTWSTFIGGILLVAIFGLAGGAGGVRAAVLITLIGVALMLLSTGLFVALMGNKLAFEFALDEVGVHMKSVSRRVKWINRLTLILGVLARKPGVAGAGAAAMSQESTTIAWNELSRVSYFPNDQAIFLRGDLLTRIRLYCTAQNYTLVEQKIRERQQHPAGNDKRRSG